MPLDRATAWPTPTRSANSSSKASTSGPSGAIQLESKAAEQHAALLGTHFGRGEVDPGHDAASWSGVRPPASAARATSTTAATTSTVIAAPTLPCRPTDHRGRRSEEPGPRCRPDWPTAGASRGSPVDHRDGRGHRPSTTGGPAADGRRRRPVRPPAGRPGRGRRRRTASGRCGSQAAGHQHGQRCAQQVGATVAEVDAGRGPVEAEKASQRRGQGHGRRPGPVRPPGRRSPARPPAPPRRPAGRVRPSG